MGVVRTRMFCCCLPVRFGAACSALINLLAGVAFSAVGWYGVHEYTQHQITLNKDEEIALILFSITYTLLVVTALLGLIGSIGAIRSLVKKYAIFLLFNTLLTIGVGIYWIWRLFHRDANECSSLAGADDVQEAVHYVCRKGFETVRIIIVVVLVIIWLFQIAGIAIVFDYVGQLNEAAELGDDEKGMRPIIDPYPAPADNSNAMRTTYDAAPYYGANAAQPSPIMKSAYEPTHSAWGAEAQRNYAFTAPGNSYGTGRGSNV